MPTSRSRPTGVAFSAACLSGLVLLLPPVHASPSTAPLQVDAKQRAALGIHTIRPEPVGTLRLSAQARVVTPAGKDLTVVAPFAGMVAQILVPPGSTVGAGHPLVRWSSAGMADVWRSLREAQAERDLAQRQLQRDEALWKEGLIPEARLQGTQARWVMAQAQLQAREVEWTSLGQGGGGTGGASAAPVVDLSAAALLRSPLSGTVVEWLAQPGQRVEAGMPLVRVADARQLQLELLLPPERAQGVRAGDGVEIPLRQAHGRILHLSPALDSAQQVVARVALQATGNLWVGEQLVAEVLPRGGAKAPADAAQRWRLPSRAIAGDGSSQVVYRVSAGSVQAVAVQVLSRTDDRVVVEGALSADAQVAVTGVTALRALQNAAE